jgi:WG containing repeat
MCFADPMVAVGTTIADRPRTEPYERHYRIRLPPWRIGERCCYSRTAQSLEHSSPALCRVGVGLNDVLLAEGVANVEANGEWGYIDKTGKKAIPPQYHANWPEGLDAHFKDGKWGHINETGKTIIPPLYAAVHKFSEGLAAVKNGDKWGYIDNSGKMVIPPQYLMADNFSEGLAAVMTGDK